MCDLDCGRCEDCQQHDTFVDLTPTFRPPVPLSRDGGENPEETR